MRDKPLGIGIRVPTTGEVVDRLDIGEMAAAVEDAGADSVWTGDHVVFTREYTSFYPTSPSGDGRATWDMTATYHDTLLGLGRMASATRRVGLGTAVFLLPLRNPVEVAKATASLDVLSGGRLILGLGVGWLAEEFEALGVDFQARGTRFDEGVEVLHRLWSGDERPYDGRTVRLPAGVLCRPLPFGGEPPRMLMGGDSGPALRRARRLGGWLGITHAANPDIDRVRAALDRIGPRATDFAVALRVLGTASGEPAYESRHQELRALGVDLVILDVPWTSVDAAHAATADLVARLS